MGEIVPGIPVVAVVLADCAPLAFAQVGSPFLPGDVRLARVVQPLLLGDIHQSALPFLHRSLQPFTCAAWSLPSSLPSPLRADPVVRSTDDRRCSTCRYC